MFEITYIDPGTKVWYPFLDTNIVVQATVDECEDIYDNGTKLAIWVRRFQDGQVEISSPTDEKDKDGWTIYEHPDASILEGHRRVNQFVWIDEPVGHSIQVGDECFLTLQEALDQVSHTNKKHLKRRLKRSRNRVKSFVESTWVMAGETSLPSWVKYPDRKIYVRRR